ncbi:MAG: hypothetical protein ACM3KR_05195 [Deltaproteobacteria bacterium]
MAILHNIKDVLKLVESLKVAAPALADSTFLEDFSIKLLDDDGMKAEMQDQDLDLFLEELNNLRKNAADSKVYFMLMLLEVLILHNIYPISPELVKYRQEVDKEAICGVNSALKPIGEAFNREKEKTEADKELADNDRNRIIEALSERYESFLRVSTIFRHDIQELQKNGQISILADKGCPSVIDINTLEELFENYALINRLIIQLSLIYDPIIVLNSSNFSCGLSGKEPPKKK